MEVRRVKLNTFNIEGLDSGDFMLILQALLAYRELGHTICAELLIELDKQFSEQVR